MRRSVARGGVARLATRRRLGNGSSGYSLQLPEPPPPSYGPIIQDVLRELTQITGRRVFARYAARRTGWRRRL